jgi:integrase/transcriptional regulator with XRE-family HTH domain
MSREVSQKEPGAVVRPISIVLGAVGSSKQITYGEVFKHLEDELSARLEAEGLSQKRVGNFRTARNGWIKLLGLTEESAVGTDFSTCYKESFERYATALINEGKSPYTISDRKSMMNAYREAWVSLLQSAMVGVMEGDFDQALDTLIESSGIPKGVIAERAAVTETTLSSWRSGQSRPSKCSLPTVHRLEEILNLSFGVLAAKLPKVLLGDAGRIRAGTTGYRKHLGEVRRFQYILKGFPPNLQSEWDDIFLFYTDVAWLKTHGLKRNSKWRIREHDNCCPTADRVHYQLGEFMGYLCLPPNDDDPRRRGEGFLREELTLALLSDSDLIYNFLQFKRERTYLRRYNSSTYNFLTLCLALLRPETGFLWQSPKLGARLRVPVTEDAWHKWCEQHRGVLMATRKELVRENEIKKTRDPFEPLRAIIVNNQHPLSVLFNLADAYEADAPPRLASALRKAEHYQNLFLIKFATLIPLRAFNLSVMTWRGDGTGNLYQQTDRTWWVRFDPSYFKNETGAAKDRPFDVPLHPTLWPYVEAFLFTHRPNLLGASSCDYVFRFARTRKTATHPLADQPVGRNFLWRQVFRLSQRYIPDCPGFGVHAFRHLVATEYIKNNPAGYAIAAAILHDREETVRKNYAWVMPADKFGFWNDYVSTLLRAREEEDDE